MTILNLMKIAESSLDMQKKTLGKGEIARYKQFLLFPRCFQKACFLGASKGVIVLEWVNRKCHSFFLPELHHSDLLSNNA